MNKTEIFQVLGIEETRDENLIKRAYREKLAVTNPEDNPEGFKRLRNAYEEACKLKDMILEDKPNNKIYINFIGPIIGSHTGQGTIALFYKGKSREIQ